MNLPQEVIDQIKKKAADSHVLMIKTIEAEIELEQKRTDRTAHADSVFDAAQYYRGLEQKLEASRRAEWELHKSIMLEHGIVAYTGGLQVAEDDPTS